jgi:hypothetical protein
MTDLMQRQQTAMEVITPDAINQLSRRTQQNLAQSMEVMKEAQLLTIMEQGFLEATGFASAISITNYMQKIVLVHNMALQGGYLTPTLHEALMDNANTTICSSGSRRSLT